MENISVLIGNALLSYNNVFIKRINNSIWLWIYLEVLDCVGLKML